VKAVTAMVLAAGLLAIGADVSAQRAEPTWQQHMSSPRLSPLVWGSAMVMTSDDTCCEQVSAAPLEPSIDASVIATLRDRAFRMGPVLWLKLVGNRSLRIIDPFPHNLYNVDHNRWRWHTLAAWWGDQQYYVVDVQLHEARAAYLVSELDGEVSIVAAPPVLSPSGRYAVALDASIISDQFLELIDLTSRPPKILEIASRPACPGAKVYLLRPKPVWLDEAHVRFEGKPILDEDPSPKQIFRIVDGQVEWEC
jgi:hypothetical protein